MVRPGRRAGGRRWWIRGWCSAGIIWSSFGGYILDFYCPAERLAIELDGAPHFDAEAIEYDRERDLFLKHFGVLVLRFVNRVVFDNPEGVLNYIREHFGWREKSGTPSAG